MTCLGDLCDISAGGTPARSMSEYWNGGIPWVKISDIKGPSLDTTEETISQLGLAKSSAKIFPKGTILYTIFATLGETTCLSIDAATNQAIAGIQIRDSTRLNPMYLQYQLASMKQKVLSLGRGVAQNNINLSILRNLEIKCPTFSEQIKVANAFSTIDQIIGVRTKQLALFDDLIKSKFEEMFGDPINNSKGLPVKNFIDVVTLKRGFDLPVAKRSAGDIPVYGSNGILGFHNESKAENGVITGRSGTIGEVHYCSGEYWPLNTTLYSVNCYGNNPQYLCYFLRYFDLSRFHQGTGVPTLNRNEVHPLQVIAPAREKQDQFVNVVKEIEKSRLLINQSLDRLLMLKQSLMQQHFG